MALLLIQVNYIINPFSAVNGTDSEAFKTEERQNTAMRRGKVARELIYLLY